MPKLNEVFVNENDSDDAMTEKEMKGFCKQVAAGVWRARVDKNGVLWITDGTHDMGYGGQWVRADKA